MMIMTINGSCVGRLFPEQRIERMLPTYLVRIVDCVA